MFRFLGVCLMATISGGSLAQMMGGAVSTVPYFPLVDGARYDYVYTSGPWATSTAVMHTGQTWAGTSGLTAMHTTYTCSVGATCAPDATDFYRMDPDGVRYFGGTGANAAGTQFSMMTFASPEWLLKHPVTPGTMMGGHGGGYQNMETWQAGVMGTNSMMGGQSYMSSYQAMALETVTTPAGTFANALHVREQRGSGYVRDVWYAPGVGMVKMNDGTNAAVLAGYTIPGAVPQPGGGAAPLAFTPITGLWWNPNESGTGYNIQVQRGVLVAAMYSYTATGDPVWYLAVGRLANADNGVTAVGTLDRYRGGQCASCTYQRPSLMGDEGSITFAFTSPTTATLQLAGGRVTQIQPLAW
jgi:hypothetical protein